MIVITLTGWRSNSAPHLSPLQPFSHQSTGASYNALIMPVISYKPALPNISTCRLASRAEGGQGCGGNSSGEALANFASTHRTAPAFLARISELVHEILMDCVEIKLICRFLSGQTLVRVKAENEMFKRTIMEKEKEQRKEYRKMREAIKKKEQQIEKQVAKTTHDRLK